MIARPSALLPAQVTAIEAGDDDEARRLYADQFPHERLQIVRQDADELARLWDGAVMWFPF